MITDDQKELLTPIELAEWLKVPIQTIYTWRSSGTGPRAFRVGKHLRYRTTDVNDWLEDQAKR